jgi:hypothetical protein
MEELARPKRLFVNALSLEGSGTDINVPEALDEGQSFVHESVATGSARNLSLKAKLWGKVVSFEFAPDREMSRIRSALATASPDLDLSDTELKALAYRGRAVTRLTSYLAIEPGVRPSSEGIERSEGGSGGLGIGLGAISSGSRADVALPFRHQAYLEEMVDRARIDCGVSFLRASVTIETNYSEIVDVIRAQIVDAPPSASGCLTERLWSLELPSKFNQTRATYTVYR